MISGQQDQDPWDQLTTPCAIGPEVEQNALDRLEALTVDELEALTVEELRAEIKLVKDMSTNFHKGDGILCRLMALQQKLMEAERARPLEEQFPFLRCDVDISSGNISKLTADVAKLVKATLLLSRYVENKSDEMESNAVRVFVKWLQGEGYTDVSENETIPSGIIRNSDGQDLVQWDGIIDAQFGIVQNLFLLEVKEIAHANDIPKLLERAQKTISYLRGKVRDDLGKPFRKAYRNQLLVLQDYANADVVVTIVYIAGSVRTDFKGKLAEARNEVDFALWLAPCPRFETFTGVDI
ncbi:hypothetical protein B484DRAFT_458984, partial [Ochromonadaceae sp. CCMP2298]